MLLNPMASFLPSVYLTSAEVDILYHLIWEDSRHLVSQDPHSASISFSVSLAAFLVSQTSYLMSALFMFSGL